MMGHGANSRRNRSQQVNTYSDDEDADAEADSDGDVRDDPLTDNISSAGSITNN
jgi:hypothetical protein